MGLRMMLPVWLPFERHKPRDDQLQGYLPVFSRQVGSAAVILHDQTKKKKKKNKVSKMVLFILAALVLLNKSSDSLCTCSCRSSSTEKIANSRKGLWPKHMKSNFEPDM